MAKVKVKTLDQANIPDMIEMILPNWEQVIISLQHKTEPLSNAEVQLTVKLANALTNTYTLYRIMKAETKKDFMPMNITRLTAIADQLTSN